MPFFSYRSSHFGFSLLCVVALLLASAVPATAQFRDIGYTLEPTVSRTFEADNAAYQDAPLYGGALGLSFGRYLELSTEYVANTGLTASFSNVEGLVGLLDRNLDVRRYGGRLRVNLYNRRVIPYLTAGSGVLRLDPENVDASSTIYALAGGGITFSVRDRYRLSLSGEVQQYRYDPVATFLPSGEQRQNQMQTVVVPALNASVSLFLGGRSLDAPTAVDRALQEQFGSSIFKSLRLFATPFAGRIEFNDALGFPKDQNLTGINAGVELGPYVGLRGFYWRAKKGDAVLDELSGGFEDLQMYGGELRLRLNAEIGRGFVPYAVLGGGYLDVMSGYDEALPTEATAPDDRFFSTLGGGLEVPLTQSVKISGGLRSVFMGNPNAEALGDPGTVYGSLMYTAGVEFRLGGGPDAPERPGREPLLDRLRSDREARAPLPDDRQAAIDSLERDLARLRGDDPSAADSRSNVSGETMTLPVPEQGEIYIRFGDPVGTGPATARRDTLTGPQTVRASEMAQVLQQALRQRSAADSALTASDIDRIVRQSMRRAGDEDARTRAQTQQEREMERMAEEIDRLRDRLETARAAPDSAATSDPAPPFYQQTFGRPLTYVTPILGGRLGEGPEQVQLGVRADYRSSPTSRFHLLPEVAIGVGDGRTSLSLLFNGAYTVFGTRVRQWTGLPLQPYVGAGGGIVSDSGLTLEPVLNLMVGTTYTFGGGQTLFGEFSTLDLLNTNRITFGYRIRI